MTNGRSRVVGEFDLELTKDGQAMVLPFAVVVEPNPAEQGVWIRTYGQNQAAFQQAKADHDFVEEVQELKLNTELTREIRELTREVHENIVGTPRQAR